MQIDAGAYTCSVVLKNGFTLKLFYNDPGYGIAVQRNPFAQDLVRSQSCWLFQNQFVYDVQVGLA